MSKFMTVRDWEQKHIDESDITEDDLLDGAPSYVRRLVAKSRMRGVAVAEPSGVLDDPGLPHATSAAAASTWQLPIITAKDSLPLNAARKRAYVQDLSATGLERQAALSLGVCYEYIETERQKDTDFDKLCSEALEVYRERIQATLTSRALYGWIEPVFHEGLHIGNKRKFDHSLLQMEAKRVQSEYRQNSTSLKDLSDDGFGVLAVKQIVDNEKDWEKNYS